MTGGTLITEEILQGCLSQTAALCRDLAYGDIHIPMEYYSVDEASWNTSFAQVLWANILRRFHKEGRKCSGKALLEMLYGFLDKGDISLGSDRVNARMKNVHFTFELNYDYVFISLTACRRIPGFMATRIIGGDSPYSVGEILPTLMKEFDAAVPDILEYAGRCLRRQMEDLCNLRVRYRIASSALDAVSAGMGAKVNYTFNAQKETFTMAFENGGPRTACFNNVPLSEFGDFLYWLPALCDAKFNGREYWTVQ